MLRFLIILLVLLNAIALAAWQGWMGQDGTRREPERVTNQLKPDQISVLDEAGVMALQAAQRKPAPAAAPATVTAPATAPTDSPAPPPTLPAPSVPAPVAVAVPVPQGCVAFTDLDDATADTLLRDVRAETAFTSRDVVSTDVSSWWVHIPTHPTKAAAERRAAEIRAKGWTDLFVVGENGARPLTISLGLFKSAEAANEQRRRIEAKGVRGVAIQERGETTHRIEIRGPAEALIERTGRWSGVIGGATRQDCLP